MTSKIQTTVKNLKVGNLVKSPIELELNHYAAINRITKMAENTFVIEIDFPAFTATACLDGDINVTTFHLA